MMMERCWSYYLVSKNQIKGKQWSVSRRNSCIKPDDELEDGASTVGNRETFDGVSLQDVVGNGDKLDVLLITAVENRDEVEGNSLSSVDITSSVLPTSCKSASGTMSLYK